jgi:hypothetical protein
LGATVMLVGRKREAIKAFGGFDRTVTPKIFLK